MPIQKQMEQSQDSESKNTGLDRRYGNIGIPAYGKIGIPAVAGAVRRKPEPRKASEPRRFHYESD